MNHEGFSALDDLAPTGAAGRSEGTADPRDVEAELRLLRAHGAPGLERLRGLTGRYRAARPWPHLVLDDLLAPDVLARAYAQESARALTLPVGRSHRLAKAETDVGFGPAAAAVLAYLQSRPVVAAVEAVTGVTGLEPDPTHAWAGLHVNPRGAFHSLHADFTHHPVDGRAHRVNVLVYLNPTWKPQWGGVLELWAPGATTRGARVEPLAPTVVLFETTATTIHGLPDPVAAPEGIHRVSLNCFYYTQESAGRGLYPLLRRPRRPGDPLVHALATRGEIVHGLAARTPEPWRALRRRAVRWWERR